MHYLYDGVPTQRRNNPAAMRPQTLLPLSLHRKLAQKEQFVPNVQETDHHGGSQEIEEVEEE